MLDRGVKASARAKNSRPPSSKTERRIIAFDRTAGWNTASPARRGQADKDHQTDQAKQRKRNAHGHLGGGKFEECVFDRKGRHRQNHRKAAAQVSRT